MFVNAIAIIFILDTHIFQYASFIKENVSDFKSYFTIMLIKNLNTTLLDVGLVIMIILEKNF